MLTNLLWILGISAIGFFLLLAWSLARIAGQADEALGYKERLD